MTRFSKINNLTQRDWSLSIGAGRKPSHPIIEPTYSYYHLTGVYGAIINFMGQKQAVCLVRNPTYSKFPVILLIHGMDRSNRHSFPRMDIVFGSLITRNLHSGLVLHTPHTIRPISP